MIYVFYTAYTGYKGKIEEDMFSGHVFRGLYASCTTIHRYPIFSTRHSVMYKVYTGYCGTSEIEHGLCACTVDNPLAKARGLSLRTGAQTMLYLSLIHPIYIRVQIGTHHRTCLLVIIYVVHLGKRGYTAYIAYKIVRSVTTFSEMHSIKY